MRPTDTTTDKLWRIAEPVCTSAGYELVDIALTQSPGGWVLRVFIDHAAVDAAAPTASSRIGFDDCERVSRELSAVLDVEDPIGHAYSLEVSSPGLDRPLRTRAHFARFMGQVAKVALREGIEGRRNFKGTLVALEQPEGSSDAMANDLLVMNVDGTVYRLPFRDIESARLVPDWDALFLRER